MKAIAKKQWMGNPASCIIYRASLAYVRRRLAFCQTGTCRCLAVIDCWPADASCREHLFHFSFTSFFYPSQSCPRLSISVGYMYLLVDLLAPDHLPLVLSQIIHRSLSSHCISSSRLFIPSTFRSISGTLQASRATLAAHYRDEQRQASGKLSAA